ncbi:MAG: hypothetical protein CVU87_03935 [Firmicutes bacterium HGW-Firmicutes-12]|jgi:hypothetical protein|nr:MAG: hypothetical protein CVU87_03935 [Firmicutes bacterium HGW-Firmicutes-12]
MEKNPEVNYNKENRRFLLTRKSDGIYLTAIEGNLLFPISVDQLCAKLLKRKIPIDLELIKQVHIEATGQEVVISNVVNDVDDKPLIDIRVNQDHSEAYLLLVPFINGTRIEKQDIEDVLKESKITYGIKDNALTSLIEKQNEYNEILIAEGRPCIPGEDAVLVFHFNTQGIEIKPQELSDGTVDFHNLDLIQIVEDGALLVEKKPFQLGENGITIYGEERKAPSGKDKRLPNGKNTQLVENNLKLIAAKTGHVVYVNKKVIVYPSYEVRGDVDFNTGNITFNGNVIIFGNVNSSFTVEATGDVEIHGNLEGVVITQGNLQVKKGIVRGKAYAGGSIYARYIENGLAESKGDIVVTDAIMHSDIKADNKVIVGGKKGLLVGGKCCVGEEIQARNIGSQLGTLTILEVGICPELRQEYKDINRKLIPLKENYTKNDKIIRTLQEIKQKTGELTENRQDIYLKSTRLQYRMTQEIEELIERKNELEILFKNMEKARIKVRGTVFSGVNIFMGKSLYAVIDEMKNVIFNLEGHDIKYIIL